MSLRNWLQCPNCRRGGQVVGLRLEKKSITMQCGSCGTRENVGFGFSRPIFFGAYERLLDVYNELEDRIGPYRADDEVFGGPDQ